MKRYKRMLRNPEECDKVYKILTHANPTISSIEEMKFIAKKRSVLAEDATSNSLEERLVCKVLKGEVFPTPMSLNNVSNNLEEEVGLRSLDR